MNFKEKIAAFVARLGAAQTARFAREYPNLEAPNVHAHFGSKYVRVDVGDSGKYMVDLDGNIFGIKGYGRVHKGHRYGTLDTIELWDWSGYHAVPLRAEVKP